MDSAPFVHCQTIGETSPELSPYDSYIQTASIILMDQFIRNGAKSSVEGISTGRPGAHGFTRKTTTNGLMLARHLWHSSFSNSGFPERLRSLFSAICNSHLSHAYLINVGNSETPRHMGLRTVHLLGPRFSSSRDCNFPRDNGIVH